jgi:AraC-like DNA-binding protein
LGALGDQLQDSLTLFQCLNRYNETVSRYSSHAKFWLERHGDVYRFCRQGIDLISFGRDYVEQFTIQVMIRIVRMAAVSKWQPCRIRIQANSDEFFRVNPRFDCVEIQTASPVTSIEIPLILGAQAIPNLCELPLQHQINEMLVEYPDQYRMHIDHAAKSMGIGRRTLQRHLAHEGGDWRGLVERIRFREAIRLLTETDIKLIELAQRVGYTDQANFGRAFRKWTGMPPRTYRELRLQ